ncbi:MAG: methyltransferase domain-containing protein [Acidobacteriota bacterium]
MAEQRPNREDDTPRPDLQDAERAAAEGYEALLVPALTSHWTEPLLDATRVTEGDRVLDVACGTGIAARGARRRVGETGSVVAVDPGAGMLAVAARLEPAIDWRRGVAEDLPVDESAFDVVLCQLGLMFFNDRHQALRAMRRALRPGGRLGLVVWDSLAANPAYATFVALLERLAGTAAADGVRAPFALGDVEALRALCVEAGLAETEITTRSGHASFPSLRAMLEADLRGWLPLLGIVLDDALIDRIIAEAKDEMASLVDTDGTLEFPSSAHLVTAARA